MTKSAWPSAEMIETERLDLEPLQVDHAVATAAALDDEGLHEFTGGRPATPTELRTRYTRLVAGQSPDKSRGWLNWVVRHRLSGEVIGTVQATLWRQDGLTAEIAWVIASPHQRQGYAKEAAAAMVGWLRLQGVVAFVAHIHPAHDASIGVARYLGLLPTDSVQDGEIRWAGRLSRSPGA